MWVTTKVCVALLICVGVTVVRSERSCTAADEGKPKCANCAGIGTCTSGKVSATTACTDSQVCKEFGVTALCVSAVGDTFCNNCGSGFLGCDPFDPARKHICRKGKTPTVNGAPCGVDFKCQAGQCVKNEGPSTAGEACAQNPSTALLIATVKPSCTSGVLCEGTNAIDTVICKAGEYFNPDSGGCKSLPVNHCESISDGVAANLTDCTKGVRCQDGVALEEIPCGPGQAFVSDGDLAVCADNSDGAIACPGTDGCTFQPPKDVSSPITTGVTSPITSSPNSTVTSIVTSPVNSPATPTVTTPSTASPATPGVTLRPATCNSTNANRRYPDVDCKKYWTCRLVSSAVYQYVQSTCIGTLVFNPTNLYCDVPANWPKCTASG